jgi:hypothetical protein
VDAFENKRFGEAVFAAKCDANPRGAIRLAPKFLRGAEQAAEMFRCAGMCLRFIPHDSMMVIAISMLFIVYSNGCGNYFERDSFTQNILHKSRTQGRAAVQSMKTV